MSQSRWKFGYSLYRGRKTIINEHYRRMYYNITCNSYVLAYNAIKGILILAQKNNKFYFLIAYMPEEFYEK